jgi:hypothetical protein
MILSSVMELCIYSQWLAPMTLNVIAQAPEISADSHWTETNGGSGDLVVCLPRDPAAEKYMPVRYF